MSERRRDRDSRELPSRPHCPYSYVTLACVLYSACSYSEQIPASSDRAVCTGEGDRPVESQSCGWGLSTVSVLMLPILGAGLAGIEYAGIVTRTLRTCTEMFALTSRIWHSTCSTSTPVPWIIQRPCVCFYTGLLPRSSCTVSVQFAA